MHLTLGNITIITNNTEVLITDIGEDAEGGLPSLICHTDLTECCRNSDTGDQGGRGEWYYPDGRVVQNNDDSTAAGEGFYRVRNAPQVVRLVRRVGNNPLSPTGLYCCVIPTTGGEMTFCINIGISLYKFQQCMPSFASGYCQLPMTTVVCWSLRLPNGMISYSDPSLGVDTVANHTCDTGYHLGTLSDQYTRTCETGSSWSGSAVNCTGMLLSYGVFIYCIF